MKTQTAYILTSLPLLLAAALATQAQYSYIELDDPLAGSVIVREHKGVLHEVMIVPDGFCWRGQTFDSLSIIAKRITGVSWNGPRFFGLRAAKNQMAEAVQAGGVDVSPAQIASQGARSSSNKPSRRSGRRSSIRMGLAP